MKLKESKTVVLLKFLTLLRQNHPGFKSSTQDISYLKKKKKNPPTKTVKSHFRTRNNFETSSNGLLTVQEGYQFSHQEQKWKIPVSQTTTWSALPRVCWNQLKIAWLHQSRRFTRLRINRTKSDPLNFVKRSEYFQKKYWRWTRSRCHLDGRAAKPSMKWNCLEVTALHQRHYIADSVPRAPTRAGKLKYTKNLLLKR